MARPTKNRGFRPIVVDGGQYRWRVGTTNRAGDIEIHGNNDSGIHGQRLCVLVAKPAPTDAVESNIRHQGGAILPATVATIIRDAIAKGWHPDVAGEDFNLCLFSRNALPA
ncbi:MAG TPA: hypothetical protein VGJ26_18850 [Pirellulales bacterium]|jgi:hypothetical protein